MKPLNALVVRAQQGNLEAYGQLVHATQAMVYAVALGVARDSTMAEDAVQEAYLRAFRRLGDLEEPGAFLSWLRRIVIAVALNMRRGRRLTLLQLDDIPETLALRGRGCRRGCCGRRLLEIGIQPVVHLPKHMKDGFASCVTV